MKPHALSSVPEVLYSPDQARNDEQRVHTDADKVRALIITEDHACAFESRRGREETHVSDHRYSLLNAARRS